MLKASCNDSVWALSASGFRLAAQNSKMWKFVHAIRDGFRTINFFTVKMCIIHISSSVIILAQLWENLRLQIFRIGIRIIFLSLRTICEWKDCKLKKISKHHVRCAERQGPLTRLIQNIGCHSFTRRCEIRKLDYQSQYDIQIDNKSCTISIEVNWKQCHLWIKKIPQLPAGYRSHSFCICSQIYQSGYFQRDICI